MGETAPKAEPNSPETSPRQAGVEYYYRCPCGEVYRGTDDVAHATFAAAHHQHVGCRTLGWSISDSLWRVA